MATQEHINIVLGLLDSMDDIRDPNWPKYREIREALKAVCESAQNNVGRDWVIGWIRSQEKDSHTLAQIHDEKGNRKTAAERRVMALAYKDAADKLEGILK